MAREPNLPSGYVTSVYFESSASSFPSHPQINTGAALSVAYRRVIASRTTIIARAGEEQGGKAG